MHDACSCTCVLEKLSMQAQNHTLAQNCLIELQSCNASYVQDTEPDNQQDETRWREVYVWHEKSEMACWEHTSCVLILTCSQPFNAKFWVQRLFSKRFWARETIARFSGPWPFLFLRQWSSHLFYGDETVDLRGPVCDDCINLWIWVWVKIRYPNNWMVNTKPD